MIYHQVISYKEQPPKLNKQFRFLSKKHASHVKKLKLLYEQCGRHVEDCQDSLDTNFDATVPSERASEMEKFFPEPRKSGTFLIFFIFSNRLFCP